MIYSIIQKSQLKGTYRLDAEYYQLEYLEIERKLNSLKTLQIKNIAEIINEKFKPIKGNKFDYIEIAEVDTITGEYKVSEINDDEAPDRAQFIVGKSAVLVSSVRPIRNAVTFIVEEHKNRLVCSSGFIPLSPIKFTPEYLFIYLKTKPIIKLLDRKTTATMYPAITKQDVLDIKIIDDHNLERVITELVNKSSIELENSKSLYSRAENLLLGELGLKDFENEENLFSVVNLSDVKNANRIDAEYFQKKYEKLVEKLKKNNAKKIGDLVSMKKGIEVGAEEYQEEGKIFIRVSSMSKYGITESDQKYLSEDLYNKLKENYEPKKGEILLTKDATPGITYVLKEDIEGIISSGILRLILKNKDIEDEYLALYLNSIIGQLQAERDAGGSVIAHWKPEQIKEVLIPILPKPAQQKIADLVQKSHEARKKSKELLEEAKTRVENLIENK